MEQRSCSTIQYSLMARFFPLLATLASNFIRQALSPPVRQFQTCVHILFSPEFNPRTLDYIPIITLKKA